MPLILPRIVCFDTATLNRVAHDFWAASGEQRSKARAFLSIIYKRGIYPALTIQHVAEMLRHENDSVAQNRLSFLRQLNFVAWLRPYKKTWFPGGLPDLFAYEIKHYTTGQIRDWREIVSAIRPTLWETGVGSDLFVDDHHFWNVIRSKSLEHHKRELAIASIARTDAGGHTKDKVADIEAARLLSPERLERYIAEFGAALTDQLRQHGDGRLQQHSEISAWFCSRVVRDVLTMNNAGDFTLDRYLSHFGLSRNCLTPGMTVEQLGELAIFQERLANISRYMGESKSWSVSDIPIAALPSYVLERALAEQQLKAPRVSGSDLGDSHNLPLMLYTDGFEADKRTFEYLGRICRAKPNFNFARERVVKTGDYLNLLDRLG